jgi:hypothetical protein
VADRDVPRRVAQQSHRRACLFDGPINGERFRAYVDQFLVPTLKPGDVVILDNLGSHKGKAVRKAIRDVGARLVFLPKYFPDLNPIEQVQDPASKGRGAKLRSHLRRLRRNHRPIPAHRTRRIPQKRRIRVDPKAGRSKLKRDLFRLKHILRF